MGYCINPNHPKSSKNLQGHFLGKYSTVGNWYFHLFKITTWQKGSTGHMIMKDQRKYMVHFEDKGMFQKCTGGGWRVQEGS